MRQMTDETMARYAAAAATLPAETVRDVMARCERHAAHTDDAADALPYALLALADAADRGETLPVALAVTVALNGARRDRIRRESVQRPTAPDEMPEREVPAPQPQRVTLADALALVPSAAAVLLSGVAARGLARVVQDRLREAQRTGRPADLDAPLSMERRALRVGDVAAATGAPAPHTRAASRALRVAACTAWGRVSVEMGTAHRGEDAAHRGARALSYVETDAARLGAAWRRGHDGIAGATSTTTTPDTLRRLGWVAPVADPVSGSLTRSMPEPRKGAARRSRKGVTVPSTSTRYAGGLAADEMRADGEMGTAHGALVAGTTTGTTDARRALVAGREVERNERAAAAHAARAAAVEQLRPCSRPLPVPAATSGADWWACGCGATPGALATVWPVDPTDAPLYAHPLPVCSVPLVGADGAARCGCGRKRGALVTINGAHHHRRVSR